MHGEKKILNVISKLEVILKNEYPAIRSIFKNLKKKEDIKYAIQSFSSIRKIKNVMQLTRDERILEIQEGRDLLVYLLTIGDNWTMGIYNNIRVSLETADVNRVKIYATIFMKAWQEANESKNIIETCLENLIYHCLRTKRNNDEREKLGQNLLTFLECFHIQKNVPIKQMVCDYYHQFLWTYLEAPGSCVKCNTAEVLFIAYPINLTKKLKNNNYELKSYKYLHKQHKAITNLLRDSNSNVRAVALKGVFQILEKFWITIPKETVNLWLRLAIEYTETCNNPEIRKSVFQGFKSLLKNSRSHFIIKKMIPKFLNSLYDSNIDVKLSVLDLFLEIENCTNIEISNSVSLNIIVHCLETNSHTEVVSSLHKLLWIRISFAKIEGRILNEIIDCGQLNLIEFRKFLLHSNDIICYETALEILNLLLPEISRLTELLNEAELDVEDEQNETVKKKSRGEKSEQLLETDVSKLTAIQILIDASALLYLINRESLTKNGHKKLNNDIIETMRNILEKFQDSEISELAIFFLSLMPKKLIKNIGKFLQKYKGKIFQENLSENMLSSILHLFFKWNEIDFLFELFPFLLTPDGKLPIGMAPFVGNVPKSDLGIKLLEIILDSNFLCNYLPEYYTKMINLWENLCFLEKSIEIRLGNNFSHSLSDSFLNTSFKHYVSLIPKLDSENFQSEKHFSRIIVWTREIILPHISYLSDFETDDLGIDLLKSVLNTSNNMINELKASPKLCCEIIILYSKCLMEKCGIIFVKFALVTILALMKFSTKMFKNDESKLLKTLVPSLFVAVMITLTKYPETLIKAHTANLESLEDLVKNIFPLLSESLDLRMKYMSIIFNTAVFCLSKELKKLLNNEQIFSPENMLNQEFSFVTEEIMKIISHVEEFDDLCVNILNRNFSKYNVVDQLSSLMFVQRLIKQRKKSTIKSRKKIRTTVSLIKEQNDKFSQTISTSHDQFISDSKKLIIEKLMS